MLTQSRIDAFISDLELNAASPNTVRAYRADLELALREVGETTTDTEYRLAVYLNEHRSSYAPKTLQRKLGTFRAFAKFNGTDRFLDSYRAPKPPPPQPHPIAEGVDGVLAMIAATRNPRHRSLITMTGLLGLRVGEAIAVRPEHFDTSGEHIKLTVRGKGDKTRIVPVPPTAWSHIRRAYELAIENGTTLTRITNRGGRKTIKRLGRKALDHDVASHDMRATFATAALDKTKNLRAVQELLGHADVKTTQVYTMVSETDMRAAAEVA